jgi:exodeoxyribonuclease V gamma subunit
VQQAVFDACVDGHYDGLHARLRARALLPSGPLGERQLSVLVATVKPYAEAYAQWRGNEAATSVPVELALDGMRLHGRVEQVHRHGLPRMRYDKLHGPAQIDHGLDWLLLCAQGDGRTLVQFHETETRPGMTTRDAIVPDAARTALRALLRLRAHGLNAPLPFGPRAGWAWYDAVDDEKGWNAAQRKWHVERGYSEGDTDSARLALRGRDPFADPELGDEFRAVARIVFGAVVHGRDAEAT